MSGPYRCVVMDPPWPEYGGGGRGAQQHYTLMRPTEILRTIVRSPMWNPAASAHLWVWATDNYLESALGLIDSLGFQFKRTFCWVKMGTDFAVGDECLCAEIDPSDLPCICCESRIILAEQNVQIGLGQYARGAHELCLFATRGDAMVPTPEHRPLSVIFAPRREHSRKPDECFTEWFEKVSHGPNLEMFCREARHGWSAWGNQVDKFQPHLATEQQGE